MKKHKNIVHAYCPVRQKTKQGDVCTATDTPCVYCADRDGFSFPEESDAGGADDADGNEREN